ATAVETALIIRAKRDPERTIDLAQKFLTGDALERTLTESFRQLTASDPKTAGQLVISLPPGSVQTSAALNVARALAAQQPEAAVSWIKTLPAGQLQQLALNNVLDLWGATNPEGA